MQTKYLASILTLGVTLTAIPVMPSHAEETFKVPTSYELQNKQQQLKVTYSTTSFTGEPRLDYQKGRQILQFAGDEIQTTKTEIGTLVTVTLYKTVDTGSTTFTLLIPAVNIGASNQANIITKGITTVNRFSTIPAFNEGQRQTYTVTPLFGTAQALVF
ncbi:MULTISPECIES: hypothetical protein [Nostoc]|uniref:Uncharacterized protein n=1 Tax=Nostoc paludosum FACHB-159 TaxID=2692908 RepID=A0ABR8K1W2_9NOSO|nr:MULTISPECIES: hypothetical protein [Nostoc]MBD2678275.1 hypothetical protein [Nostoc sp. FACHB-857]MBD2733393.1 hypothetical protein [Nostoc paludosum FACHB-159]